MIGIGLGLVAGGLAYYALKKTYSYPDELERRIESQPKVVKALLQELVGVWLLFLPVAGVSLPFNRRAGHAAILSYKWCRPPTRFSSTTLPFSMG